MSVERSNRHLADHRPRFHLLATGDPLFCPETWGRRESPEAWLVTRSLEELMWRRVCGHAVTVYARSTDGGPSPTDEAVRTWCERRKVPFMPEGTDHRLWGIERAGFRRDLWLVAFAHAVVWFGDREGDRDVVWLAETLGVPCRVVTADGMIHPVGPVRERAVGVGVCSPAAAAAVLAAAR